MSSSSQQLWSYAQGLGVPCEESRRAKISRAYYALYHHARDFHSGLPKDENGRLLSIGGGVHQKLIQQLTNPDAKDLAVCTRSRTIGNYLMLARELRDMADYDNAADVDRNKVNDCIRFVEKGLKS
jgi:hypothetical protein